MHIVGQFLGKLFANHTLPKRSEAPQLFKARSLTALSLSQDFTQLLYYCPNYSQGDLIRVVLGICQGVPEAYEVFRCHPSTTEGELSLFLKRAARHSLRSIVLEVNKLPFKLQEVSNDHYYDQYRQCIGHSALIAHFVSVDNCVL